MWPSNLRFMSLALAALCLSASVQARWVVHFKPENKQTVLAELAAAGWKTPVVGSFFAAVEGARPVSQGGFRSLREAIRLPAPSMSAAAHHMPHRQANMMMDALVG